jgi:uncharacterized protein (DUF302 family)
MTLDHTVPTAKSVPEAVEAIKQATAERNFRVLAVHDVQATLAEKGFGRGPLSIVEVCNAKFAHAVLDADPKIALMLPCPVVAYEQDGQTYISTMLPSLIAGFYPSAGIEDVAGQVETILLAIVDAAAA